MRKIQLLTAVCLGICTLSTTTHADDIIFFDDFNDGASQLWGNERGEWAANAGVYFAGLPNNIPPTYTSIETELTDLVIDVDINDISDGGIWLRSDFTDDSVSGVLLVTGGWTRTGTGLYWHVVHDDSYSAPLNEVRGLFVNGDSDPHLTIKVTGDLYQVFVDGSDIPATELTTSDFASGEVALYDFSAQTFDNFQVAVPGGSALDVSPNPLLAGQPGTFTATNLVPNAKTYLAYSTKGAGATFVPFLNVTLDLRRPKQAGGQQTADPLGSAQWVLNIPPNTVGLSVSLQAAQFENKTNVVDTTIE